MVFTFLWLILCGFIDKTSEIKRNKQQKSSYSMLYLLYFYLFKLISINLVLYFRMQVPTLLLLPPLLAGWHLIAHKNQAQHIIWFAAHMFRQPELETWKVLVCAPQDWWIIAFCYLYRKFLLFWAILSPEWKRKVIQWPNQLVRTTSKSFFSYAESNGQSSNAMQSHEFFLQDPEEISDHSAPYAYI